MGEQQRAGRAVNGTLQRGALGLWEIRQHSRHRHVYEMRLNGLAVPQRDIVIESPQMPRQKYFTRGTLRRSVNPIVGLLGLVGARSQNAGCVCVSLRESFLVEKK